MDPQTFAAQRDERLAQADAELAPFVRAMLTRWGDDDFDADLLDAASVLWLEVYQAEAPKADEAKHLAAFQEALHASLLETTDPDSPPAESQVTRITRWISTYGANDATWRGTTARGGKFTRWNSMGDRAVRDTHVEADGQVRPVGGTFDVGGFDLHYPGEPVGPPSIWINCRCLIQPAARQGDAMSGTTYTIGPEDGIDDNPDIIPGSDVFAIEVDPFPGEEEGDGIHVDEDVASGAVVEWIDEMGTRYYGPFDTAENAQRWIESDSAPFDGEARVIETVEVPKAEPVIAAAFDMAGAIADAPVDDEVDDEELITEIPVHGVLAPEGVATGDGREFAIGALSVRDLPLPLRYEIIGSHGGDTSHVVTVGRIDNAWRDDASNSWRWTGAVVLSKPHAQEVIEGLVDGTVRGISIDGDDAEVQVQEMGEGDDPMDALLDMMGGGRTVFSKMRVAGATIVPIPAFQEAYTALGHEFQEDLSTEELGVQAAALAACGCATGEYRDFPPEKRAEDADTGKAMPDGSYPIENCEDLANAIHAIGRAKDPEATKAHIRKRKAALGCPEIELPADWTTHAPADASVLDDGFGDSPESAYAAGTHDGPGWITDPIPTARIRRYWTHGEGAAKIAWGAPGDFNRCRMQLAKYVQNPEWLAGLCANMHKEALGFWPAQHHSAVSQALIASAGAPVARLVEAETTVYPGSWFSNPNLGRAVPLRIEPDTRRAYGYVAEWGVCHVGMAGMCQEVPRSMSNYGYYLKGLIDTDQGEQPVGVLSFGGHASAHDSMARASNYYDKPDAVRAFVNVGEDEFGVWFAGVVPPDVSDADIAKMRAIGAVSGDWREVRGQLELIGVPIVNTPGFPVLASASGGRQTSLIGAGALKPEVIQAAAKSELDADTIAGIIRATVAETRHQDKIAARAEPARAKVRERRLLAARARTERD